MPGTGQTGTFGGVTVPWAQPGMQPGRGSPAVPAAGADRQETLLHSLPVKQALQSQALGEFLHLFVATFQL